MGHLGQRLGGAAPGKQVARFERAGGQVIGGKPLEALEQVGGGFEVSLIQVNAHQQLERRYVLGVGHQRELAGRAGTVEHLFLVEGAALVVVPHGAGVELRPSNGQQEPQRTQDPTQTHT